MLFIKISHYIYYIGLRVDNVFWDKLKKLNKLLAPLTTLTTQLQSDQLTIPKFNEFWTIASLELDAFIESNAWTKAKKLKSLMDGRKDTIYNNPIIKAGIYLDPRFRRSLSFGDQEEAKNVIRAIFFKNVGEKFNSPVTENSNPENIESDSETMNGFEKLIGSYNRQCFQETSRAEPLSKLDTQLSSYENLKNILVTAKTDPTEFWKRFAANSNDPFYELSNVALEIICAPVTEVTAERLFSFLSYIFNKLRSCLKSYP